MYIVKIFIFLGDHKQLRPSPAVYNLAREYNFDVSLFERMVNNGIGCDTLKQQHRMRPEIAQLIAPTIYPDLQNHPKVETFEKVRGMLKSVFFLTHNHLEEEVSNYNFLLNNNIKKDNQYLYIWNNFILPFLNNKTLLIFGPS